MDRGNGSLTRSSALPFKLARIVEVSSVPMAVSAIDFRKLIHIAAPVAIAVVALTASRLPSRAATNHMVIIPASDGYGFDDCLSANKACGRTIADAWCEAHGMAASLSYGRAEDITASIPKPDAGALKIEPGSFVVNCRD